jgi:hypothetical protein
MIQPAGFSFNAETAVNNAFQSESHDRHVGEKALQEFEELVGLLRDNGIEVTVMKDTVTPYTPDAVFPNNWISFHHDHTVCLYPMFAENRRQERKPALIEALKARLHIQKIIDLTYFEKERLFLEGTGSMVLDRSNHIAYACISPRTSEKALAAFCKTMEYTPVVFEAYDKKGIPVYHTNVMMCIAENYAVICLESIAPDTQKTTLADTIKKSGKTIIPVSFEQMAEFAGNMLQLENRQGEKLLVMSSRAYASLTAAQLSQLRQYNRILHSPLATIESNGGGSARCMIAEIF